MNRIFTFLIAILLIGNISFAQERAINAEGNYENVIRIKVREHVSKQFDALHQKDLNKIESNSKG